ncbi:MAG: hypothetical protein ABFS35_22410 [Bacteroidota bacterium]
MKLFRLLIILIIVQSCIKRGDNTPVITGQYDEGFHYHIFSPGKELELEWDSLQVGAGLDSIDVDLDGRFDITIIQVNNQSPDYDGRHSRPLSGYKLLLKNNVEVAMVIEEYYIGLGSTSEMKWVETISLNTDIKNLNCWSGEKKNESITNHIFMWSDNPEALLSTGPWSMLTNTEKFIGLRIKDENNRDFKYGWLKARVITKNQIIFESCAIEK